jgi:hypothetical protein
MDFEYRALAVGGRGAFVWADNATSSDYIPNTAYSFNSFSTAATHAGLLGPLVPNRNDALTWHVAYGSMSFSTTIHLATAYGSPNAAFCLTGGTVPVPASLGFVVACMTPDGTSVAASLFAHRVISNVTQSN